MQDVHFGAFDINLHKANGALSVDTVVESPYFYLDLSAAQDVLGRERRQPSTIWRHEERNGPFR